MESDKSCNIGDCMRKTNSSAWPSTKHGEDLEQFFEGQIAVAENVALANFPMLCGKPMTPCDVFDGNKIQARIDIGRHLAIQKIEDHAASRRGFPITGSYGGGWIDDYHGLALPRQRPATPVRPGTLNVYSARSCRRVVKWVFRRADSGMRRDECPYAARVNKSIDAASRAACNSFAFR